MNNFNKGISTANFPDILKSIKVKIVFKKSLKMKKKSRSKVFPVTSKTFENFIYIYIYIYFDSFFSKHMCGFRKGYSAGY